MKYVMEFGIEVFGFIAAVFIGFFLGLLGGGGSVLAVPVLVYLFHIKVAPAITFSLLIVGLASAFGSIHYFKEKLIDPKKALYFGLPSILTVSLTRWFIVPNLPESITITNSFALSQRQYLLLIFAILMMLSAIKMIRKSATSTHQNSSPEFPLLALYGVGVGFITGFIGVGGGFLIVPALYAFGKMTMKEAIGTSLVVIALNSLIGFSTSIVQDSQNDGISIGLIFSILAFSALGVLIGNLISKRIQSEKLKPLFGWFILLMGAFILGKEFL
ncbi:MAG: sulfite exporter TauE/SafE family protein [Chloroherpetonaceae bacterium]|nr:sulfite exporter TauE/SafE family protein [Chloroherpetonaceae bacterium]